MAGTPARQGGRRPGWRHRHGQAGSPGGCSVAGMSAGLELQERHGCCLAVHSAGIRSSRMTGTPAGRLRLRSSGIAGGRSVAGMSAGPELRGAVGMQIGRRWLGGRNLIEQGGRDARTSGGAGSPLGRRHLRSSWVGQGAKSIDFCVSYTQLQ